MNKQLVQTVYLPTDEEFNEESTNKVLCNGVGQYIQNLERKEGIFFTVEEYNAKMKEVIEETLTKASEKVEENWDEGGYLGIDKDSILNTFQESYKKFKI